MKRRLVFTLVLTLLISALLVSCGEKNNVVTRVTVLKGPTGMGSAKMIHDSDPSYQFTIASSADEARAALMSGSTDIAAVPTNLASVLYNKMNGEVRVIALNTLGVLHVVENGNTIASIEDLRNKTIHASGQGSTPEYILNYLLKKNGIDPERDVEIVYHAEHAELATLLIAGKVSVGVLPEPNVSTVLSKSSARAALDLTEEWDKLSGDVGSIVQGCVVVRRDFAEKHPEAVKEFLRAYASSVEYLNENAEDAAAIIAELGIVPNAAIAASAIPKAHIVCVSGTEMKPMLHPFLSILYEADPSSVGGKLPDDTFYYEK